MTFKFIAQLLKHAKTHSKSGKPFLCLEPGCGKAFVSKKRLQVHAEVHLDERSHKCPVAGCGKSYSKVQRLRVHLKTHTGQKDFVCPHEGCEAAFYEKGNLKTHMRLHTGEKPYRCTEKGCIESFISQSHLNLHHEKIHSFNAKKQAHFMSLQNELLTPLRSLEF